METLQLEMDPLYENQVMNVIFFLKIFHTLKRTSNILAPTRNGSSTTGSSICFTWTPIKLWRSAMTRSSTRKSGDCWNEWSRIACCAKFRFGLTSYSTRRRETPSGRTSSTSTPSSRTRSGSPRQRKSLCRAFLLTIQINAKNTETN